MENKLLATKISEETSIIPNDDTGDLPAAGLDEIFFFSIFMACGSFLLYGLLALVEALNLLWSPLSIACYLILLIIASFVLYVYLIEGEFIKKENASFHLCITLLGIILTIVSFSQICRHLSILLGGFRFNQTGYWHWLRFGMAHMLDSTLFNMPSIYNWDISEIEPTNFWTRSFTFLFDLSTQIFIVAVVLQRLQVIRKQWARRKRSHNSYFTFLFAHTKTWILIVIWGLPLIFFLGVIVRDGFSLAGTWIALLVSLPVALAIWLIWHSLLALTLKGKRNKLIAITAILAGSVLLTFTLPRFLEFLASK